MKRRGPRLRFQAITSTLSSTLVLILVGMTLLSMFAARNISDFMHENFIVTLTLGGSNDALLGTDVGMAAQTTIMQQNMEHERYVQNVKLITADEVLQQQMESIGEDPRSFLGFNPYYSEMEIDLRPKYVNSDSLRVLAKEITAKYPLVSEVNYEKDLMDNLQNNMHKLTYVLTTFTIIMLVILFALIHNMIRLSIYARRFHIQTMKLVGATYWFIRRPFLMRSLWIALTAGVLASAVLLYLAEWLVCSDEAYSQFLQTSDLVITIFAVFLCGIVLLLLSTLLSVNHFLKIKEHKLHV